MHDPNARDGQQAPNTLTPVPLDNKDDDLDIAKLRGGNKRTLALVVVCVAAAAVGGARLLQSMDAHRAYMQAASELERIENEESGAFLRCALPNLQQSQLASANGLRSAIEIAAERLDKNYPKALGKCLPLLERIEHSVKQIQPPTDISSQLLGVSNSVSAFGKAWTEYRSFLQQPVQPGAEAPSAAPLIDKITASWLGYQNARNQAKEAISARL